MNIEEFKKELSILSPVKLQKLLTDYLSYKDKLNYSGDIHYSLSSKNRKIAVRCSRPYNKVSSTTYLNSFITSKTLLSETSSEKFLCNIQQIKQIHSNEYLCNILFDEKIHVFKFTNSDLNTDKRLGYASYQHYGNTSEGQLHITNRNLPYIQEKYLHTTIDYVSLLTFCTTHG